MFDNLAYFYDTGPFGLATLCALGATNIFGRLAVNHRRPSESRGEQVNHQL